MGVGVAGDTIRVEVSGDALEARLVVPPRTPADQRDLHFCLNLLREEGVEVGGGVQKAVETLLGSWDEEEGVSGVVVEGAPPLHGEHGRVEWEVSAGDDEEEPDAEADPEAAIDFRAQHAFVMVKAGQRLGRVTQPVPGSDGRDVRGRSIGARTAKEAKFKHDESVFLDREGVIVAQKDGLLHRDGGVVRILDRLEIPGNVDYRTGNVEFDGDVVVAKDVKDLFVVDATGDVSVRGLIERATIKAGGSVFAAGGMAGRGDGKIGAGVDLVARYLDAVEAEVHGDLQLEREAINCKLLVHGSVDAPRGAIIGGRAVVRGAVVLGTVGGPSHAETELVLGTVPKMDPRLAELEGIAEQLTEDRRRSEEQLQRIQQGGAKVPQSERERMTELTFEVSEFRRQEERARKALAEAQEKADFLRTVDLRVARVIYGGSKIRVANQWFIVREDIKGPVQIGTRRGGVVVYQREGGRSEPLMKVTEVRAAA